jgi:DNA recombination protein RmuC
VLLGILGFGLGVLLTWLYLRSSTAATSTRLSLAEQELATTRAALNAQHETAQQARTEVASLKTRIEQERKVAEEKFVLLTQARDELRNAFNSMAAEALKNNNEAFLHLAAQKFDGLRQQAAGDLDQRKQAVQTLVTPINESLFKMQEEVRAIEKQRIGAYNQLAEQLRSVAITQDKLESETGNLVKALRSPVVRGQWGELQLDRVVKIAGMLSYCDFARQPTVNTPEGRLRPDLVVKLPGGRNIVVDSKVSLSAYLDALETNDEEQRRRCRAEHARQIRAHVESLGKKAYWEQFQPAPEFVVLFLPGEAFFSAGLEEEPDLLEESVQKGVIIASPTTLIALLKGIAFSWREEKLAENAQAVSLMGKELYERLMIFAQHLDGVGKSLESTVNFYNKAVGSLENRVLVSARQFPELGVAASDDLPEPRQVDRSARAVAAAFGQAPLSLAATGDEENELVDEKD